MAVINYRFFDGHYERLEVTKQVADAYHACNRAEWRVQKSRERHETKTSLTQLFDDYEFEPSDEKPPPLEQLIALEEKDKLSQALKSGFSSLLPKQRLLLRKIYIENKSLTEIAAEFGVTYQAIQNRHKKNFRKTP